MVLAAASAVASLAPALVQTFCTVALGYMLTRFHVIPAQGARAMALYVSMLAYPALVFTTLGNLDFSEVIWPFFWSTFVSRILIFLVSIGFEFWRHGFTPDSIADAGIYGIFTSQSNDLAMGVPIMQAVFAESHPRWFEMLYIVTLTRVMINPLGFYMMEYGRMKKHEKQKAESIARGDHGHGRRRGGAKDGLTAREAVGAAPLAKPFNPLPLPDDPSYHTKNLRHILTRVFINPLVISTVAGILANVAFGGKLPGAIDPFFRKLGESFNASALFVLGVAMHGQLDRLNDRRQLKTPLWLFVAKSVLLPAISRLIAVMFGLSSDLVLFAFILGTLPSSENVPFFAYEYAVPSQHVIAPAMVLGTVLAAPIMFVSAQMVNITLTPPGVDQILIGTMRVFSAVGIAFGVYFLFILWYNRRWHTVRDKLLIGLICWQLMLNLSSEFCALEAVSARGSAGESVRYAFVFTSRMATRAWMLAMAMNEIVHYFYPPGSEQKFYPGFIIGGLLTSGFVVVLTAVGGRRTLGLFEYAECFLRYGKFQWTLMAIVDGISVIVLCYAMWKLHRRLNSVEVHAPAGAGTHVYRQVKIHEADEKESIASSPAPTQSPRQRPAASPEGPSSMPPPAAPSDAPIEASDSDPEPSASPEFDHAGAFEPTSMISSEESAHPVAESHVEIDASGGAAASDQPPALPALDFYSPTPRQRRPSSSILYPTFALPPVGSREEEQSWSFGMFVFLILSLIWMVINLALSLWSATTNELSEGRIELLLLDGVLSGSQAIWTWMIFGLASHVKSPLRYVTRWVRKKSDQVINWRSS